MANSMNLACLQATWAKIRKSDTHNQETLWQIYLLPVKSPKNGEQYEDHTEWVNLVAFGKRARSDSRLHNQRLKDPSLNKRSNSGSGRINPVRIAIQRSF